MKTKNLKTVSAWVMGLSVLLPLSGVQAGILGPRLDTLAKGNTALAVPVGSQRAVSNPFAPRIDGFGRVQVWVLPAVPGGPLPDVQEVADLGAVRIQVSRLMDLVQAWVPVTELNTLATFPGVGRVRVPTYAVVEPPVGPRRSSSVFGPVTEFTSSLPTGLPIDQAAVQAMQASLLQQVGADGQGIKVGVISDDDSGNAASQAAGYLPSGIFQDPNYPGTTPTPGDPAEGTAMLEEVHAMAPQAQLGFCGPQTEADFLTCYQDLASWGAHVIVDDLGFSPVDMFTRGINTSGSFANAISTITQKNPMVAFLSAAGNDAQDYYQAPYTPTSSTCTVNGTTYASCMDFGKAIGQFSTGSTGVAVSLPPDYTFTPILEWDDPPNPSATSESSFPDQLQMDLENDSGTTLVTGTFSTTVDGRPGEILSYTTGSSAETVYLVIAAAAQPDPTAIKLLGNGDGAVDFQPFTAGSVGAGQTVAPEVIATAAAAVDGDIFNPLTTTLESYSAIGPFLYGSYTGTGTQPDPVLTGVDDVETSGAGGFSSGTLRTNGGVAFCGTSATGPNVGSLVASLMSANPGRDASFYENALEKTASTALIGTTATPESSTSPSWYQCSIVGNTQGYVDTTAEDDAGAGLAQGYAALASFFTFPTTSVTAPPNVSVSSGNTVTENVPLNVAIDYAASVTPGTNQASTSKCEWNGEAAGSISGSPQTGATAAYTFQAAGSYVVTANCPDSQGILNPSPATIDVNAENLPAPTVTLSNVKTTGFDVTLTGTEPIKVSVASSNPVILPDTGISISSGCGTTTLSCTVSYSANTTTSGSTEITFAATDPYGQSGQAQAQVSVTVPPSSGGGGGAMNPLALLMLLAIGLVSRRRLARAKGR